MSASSLRAELSPRLMMRMSEQLPYHLQLIDIALKALEPYPEIHRRAVEMAKLCRAYAAGAAVDPKRYEEMVRAGWPNRWKRFPLENDLAARMSAGYMRDITRHIGFEAFDDAGRAEEASYELEPIEEASEADTDIWFNKYFDALEAAGLL